MGCLFFGNSGLRTEMLVANFKGRGVVEDDNGDDGDVGMGDGDVGKPGMW